MDVVFLILSHGSLTHREFEQQKEFVLDVADMLGLAPGQTQAAVILYSNSATVKVQLGQYATMDQFGGAVQALRNDYGYRRRIDLAMRSAAAELGRGGRSSVPKLVVLLSNGISHTSVSAMTASYQFMRNNGVYILAVGVGYSGIKRDLQLVTESDDDIFMVTMFDVLKRDIGRIISRACFLIGKRRLN